MAAIDGNSIAYFYEAVERYSLFVRYCSCYLYRK